MTKGKYNFDQYRKQWELDDYWHLKKQFLETYCDQYETDRLLALAQVFINIEVMGNTYDESLMALIRRLTDNWESLKEFRENKRILVDEKKKGLVKSKQIENERKRLKTEFMNDPERDPMNRNFNNNNKNKSGPFTFGTQNIYTNNQDIPSYNTSNNRNKRN